MGVENYVATLKLTPITDGARTFAEWSAEFDCAEGRERELTQQIGRGGSQGGVVGGSDPLQRHSRARPPRGGRPEPMRLPSPRGDGRGGRPRDDADDAAES